jgi:hypothetical protein
MKICKTLVCIGLLNVTTLTLVAILVTTTPKPRQIGELFVWIGLTVACWRHWPEK